MTLALAAGTLGVSSGAAARRRGWSSAHLQSHGGVVGEALYQLAHTLVQDVGVDILVVFLLLVGAILLTGASLGGSAARDRQRAAGHDAHDALAGRAGAARRATPRARGSHEHALRPLHPPEPDTAELIVRATHVEAPGAGARTRARALDELRAAATAPRSELEAAGSRGDAQPEQRR